MSDRAVVFVKAISARFPCLGPVLDEHIGDNGEILPHVFFGDVTRYAVRLFQNSEASPELRDILSHLEEAFQREMPDVVDLISVSFLENLPRDGEPGGEIRKLLGPNLRKELDLIG